MVVAWMLAQPQVALIKSQSIPRLQLQTALLLTKLVDVYKDLQGLQRLNNYFDD